MSITFYGQRTGESFRALIVSEVFAGKEAAIVATVWDRDLGALCVLDVVGGQPRVGLFQDRGEHTLGGLPHRGVTDFFEDEVEVIERMSAYEVACGANHEGEEAFLHLVREDVQELRIFMTGLRNARPGDRVTLTPPRAAQGGCYAGVMSEDYEIQPSADGRWPKLANIAPLMRAGYLVGVVSKRAH